MSTFLIYAVGAVLLVGLGVYGLLTRRHLLRKVMALNVVAGGVFLLLISTAQRDHDPFPDPVPHAMVITGIVVAVSATGFALALVRRIHQRMGRDEPGPGRAPENGDAP